MFTFKGPYILVAPLAILVALIYQVFNIEAVFPILDAVVGPMVN